MPVNLLLHCLLLYLHDDNDVYVCDLTAPEVQRFVAHEEFGDRREGVVSARTYFYEDEAKCDENLQTFKECIDAVAGPEMHICILCFIYCLSTHLWFEMALL